MKENFDFSTVGKKMPYTVPAGFFEQMQANVQAELQHRRQAKRRRARIVAFTLAAAASCAAAVAIFFAPGHSAIEHRTDFNEVQQAYSQLNADDQAYLQMVYADDIFIEDDNI